MIGEGRYDHAYMHEVWLPARGARGGDGDGSWSGWCWIVGNCRLPLTPFSQIKATLHGAIFCGNHIVPKFSLPPTLLSLNTVIE